MSQYIGEPGKKLVVIVTVTSVRQVDSFFGTSYLHTMTTDDGNELVWFCSNRANALEIDEVCEIQATVKRHSEYKGIK